MSTTNPTDDLTFRELRIAPVMTGGTSLAVWMGGVDAELYSLVRSLDDDGLRSGTAIEYERLLRLTRTRPVIDVITGTSAGGLGGLLLAAAVCFGVPREAFAAGLRDTVIGTADVTRLIRSPDEENPPSLFDGSVMESQLTQLIDSWAADRHGPLNPIDLVTTFTRIRPVQRGRVDDFGEGLGEEIYAGTLHFTQDHFARPWISRRLGLAGRATAGIPGVFDPTFLGCSAADRAGTGDTPEDSDLDFLQHQAADSSRVSRWAVDGGVVVNLPLGHALDRVFNQEATALVRRVLLYVYPTPPPAKVDVVDHLAEPPTVLDSVRTVIDAPRAESISVHIDAIRRHNDQVNRQRVMRRSLGPMLGALGQSIRTGTAGRPDLFTEFQRQRAESSIEYVIERHRRTRGTVAPGDDHLRANLRRHRASLLPTRVDTLDGGGRSWAWGIAPIEEAASIALGLINQALGLAAHRVDGQRAGADAAAHQERLAELGAAKRRVHWGLREAHEIRKLDEAYWTAVLARWDAYPESSRPADVDLYALWPYPPTENGMAALADRPHVFDRMRRAHTMVTEAIVDSLAAMAGIVVEARAGSDRPAGAGAAADADDAVWPSRRQRADDLERDLALVVEGVARLDVAHVQRRLLEIHVVTTLLLGRTMSREQTCELMQLSWNAPNALDPTRRSDEKLVGTEMARLGAFLKPSWRANDWFWGRMDAAARLARLLVDGHRLHELGVTRAEAERALGIGRCPELDFLDDDLPLLQPPVLDDIVTRVTRRLQLRIAREELPRIAEAIDESLRDTPLSDADRIFRDAVRRACGQSLHGSLDDVADDDITTLVEHLRIGSATFDQEKSSDLTISLAERLYDVATLGLAGDHSGLPGLARPLAELAHWIRHGAHVWMKRQLRKEPASGEDRAARR